MHIVTPLPVRYTLCSYGLSYREEEENVFSVPVQYGDLRTEGWAYLGYWPVLVAKQPYLGHSHRRY